MPFTQPDLVGISKKFSGIDADEEISNRFGFKSEIIYDAARLALRQATQTDDIHSQQSAPGSNFYHVFIEQMRTLLDQYDDWSAQKSNDVYNSPRAYNAEGYGIAFAQGNSATGDLEARLDIRKPLGTQIIKEIRRTSAQQFELSNVELFNVFGTRAQQSLWLMLYHRNNDSVALEMALPSGVNEEGKVTGWDIRIALKTVELTENFMEDEDTNGYAGEEPVVSIAAR